MADIDNERRVLDLSSESLGQVLADITEKERLRYRIRRNLEIEIVGLSLLKHDFEFDLYFPQEIFRKMIDYASSDTQEYSCLEREAITYINREKKGSYSIIAPVYITDLLSPTSDFVVTDSDGSPLSIPNRFATSTIWGKQLYSLFSGIGRFVAGADDAEAMSGRTNDELLLKQLDDDDNSISLFKVFSSLAWIAAADTSNRFQCFNVAPYAHLFRCLRSVRNPSSLFYKGLPVGPCTAEQAAARLFSWAIQEVSLVEKIPLRRTGDLDQQYEDVFNKVLEMVGIQQEIETLTYDNREILRSILDNERYETVFEQTCPVTNPLLYIRAYVKRYMYVMEAGEIEGSTADGMQLLAEYVDHSLIYLRILRRLVILIIELAGSGDAPSAERAKRGLSVLNLLCFAYGTWRVFAFLEITPEARKKIRLSTHVHIDANSQYRERDEGEHQYIKNQIFTCKERGAARRRYRWRLCYIRTRVLFYVLFTVLQASRYVYQLIITQAMKVRMRTGFLYGRRRKALRYRLNSTSCVTIPYFLSEDCQTQHLSLRLHGTDNEIQPETTYIQTGERIYNKRSFLKLPAWIYGKLATVASWLHWDAAVRYLEARMRKSRFMQKFLGRRLRVPPHSIFGRTYLSDDQQYLHLYTTKRPYEGKYDCVLLEEKQNVRRIELPGGRKVEVGTESYIEPVLYIGVCLRKHERRGLQAICTIITGLVIASGLSVATLADSAGVLSIAGLAVITGLISLFFAFGEKSAFNEQSASFYNRSFYVLALLQLIFVIIYVFVGK